MNFKSMKKDILKIAVIFLVTVAAVVWGLNFIFLGKTPKSKADEVLTLSFDPTSATAANNGEFTMTIKATPTSAMNIQLYKININFDKSKVKIKDSGINYVVGQPSSALGGDDNSRISAINGDSGQGMIKLYGEITNPATGLIMNGATELAKITFISKTDNSYTVTNSDSSVSKVNGDYSINTVSLSNATFNVNGGGGPTATPGGGAGNAKLKLKLKFQGIAGKPADAYNKLAVKVKLLNEANENVTDYKTGDFVADTAGVWSGEVSFNVNPSAKYVVYVKGPYHIQKKICDEKPTETAAGTYRCDRGKITLNAGDNNFDLSGIVLLAGDLPVQDGSVTAYDTSLVRNNLGKTDTDEVSKADVNRDGKVDTQDYSLIIAALSVRNDE
ncbi:MAG: hypothetical protein UR89_C0040G0007 [Candidatus Roizmanbacteria bacterium GW2011_GWA2_35_8]|uniref:Dockerin domain-containing protein n=1 Tax=Candidatus Roizmanbacteria bacterium GW2011_GWA2_35_8 TaxID=1618479 RepID=A0A0G0G245_9BACT|nr:MAG: hypothetical protein UR89_C0040G0007 [Candidatus Roizmanbacteria bacterium GW2011_GWA2_35_8]